MASTTLHEDLNLLFDAKLIPQAAHDAAGPDVQVRPLAADDYERGHLRVLQALTSTPDPGREKYIATFQAMKNAKPQTYYTLALIDKQSGTLMAVGTLFLELKFIRNLGTAGHIEDISVDESMQGRGLGKKLINALTLLSESLGAYKVILDCSEDNTGFYTKCGYSIKGAQMAKYA